MGASCSGSAGRPPAVDLPVSPAATALATATATPLSSEPPLLLPPPPQQPKSRQSRQQQQLDTELLAAAETGNAELVEELLQVGAAVRFRDDFGWTALHRAAANGHEAVVTLLAKAEAGVAINLRDKFEWTPLHLAAENGHVAAIKRLLAAGAHVEGASHPDPSALAGPRGDFDGVAMESSAALALSDRTPLHRAAQYGRVEAVASLLAAGADVDARDQKQQRTALHWAIANGQVATAAALLAVGSTWQTARDAVRRSALDQAVESGQTEIVAMLLDAGASVHDADGQELRTPLHWAAERGAIRGAELMLEAGADANARDTRARTPLHRAAENDRVDVVALLLKGRFGERCWRVDIHAWDERQRTPLHLAAERGAAAAGGLLLREIHQIHLRRPPTAISRELLIEDIDGRDQFSRTPLHSASSQCHMTMMRLLLEAGANPNARTQKKQTPLHLIPTSSPSASSACLLLIQHGADPYLEDKTGGTILNRPRAIRPENSQNNRVRGNSSRGGADDKEREKLIRARWRYLRTHFVRFLNGLGPLRLQVNGKSNLRATSPIIERVLWTGLQEYNREIISFL